MKPWCTESQVPLKEELFTSTVSYLEIQQPVPNLSLVYNVYIFRHSETALLVVAHLNLDRMFQILEQQLVDPTLGGVYNKTYRETWPYFFSLIDNYINQRMSEGAILRMEDPDNGDHKYMVGTIVGNVDLSSVKESDLLFRSQRISDAHAVVIKSCTKVVQEQATRKVNTFKIGLRGAIAGGKSGSALANNLASTWLPRLNDLFGS